MVDEVSDKVQALLTELFPSGIPLSSYRIFTQHLLSLQALVELSLSVDELPPSSRCQLRVLPVFEAPLQSRPLLKHDFVAFMRHPLANA